MSLAKEDFEAAITTLHEHWRGLENSPEWKDVKVLRQYGIAFLRVERFQEVPVPLQGTESTIVDDAEHIEDDPEALVPGLSGERDEYTVTYDIVHLASYQVPVLYLTVRCLASAKLLGVEEVHQLLVPDAFRQQIEAVGVLGALSMTDHPVTSLPVYFVHPCRTQEAMQAVLGGKKANPLEYLLIWLGLAGGSVGLNVPIDLMQAMKL